MLCPDREKTWWGGKEASFQVFAIKAVRNFLALLLLEAPRPLFCCFVYTLHSYSPEARSLAVLSVRLLLYHNITRERLTDFLQLFPLLFLAREAY